MEKQPPNPAIEDWRPQNAPKFPDGARWRAAELE
jgi:hypothetical protein